MSIAEISFDKVANNTKRVYRQAILDFERVTGVNVRDAQQSHYDFWIANMRHRKLSVSTMRQRISAISRVNPTFEIALPKRENHEYTYMNADQLTAFLSGIPISCTGHMDFAMVALSTVFGLKNSQVRTLQWQQVVEKGDRYVIYLAKGSILLPRSFNMLIKTLEKNKSFSSTNEYLFIASSERCRNLPTVKSFQNDQPITSAEFNRRVKKYARLASLDEKKFSVRTLRYTFQYFGEERVLEIIESALKKRTPHPVSWVSLSRDPRLHGIGRRSR